MQVGSVHTQRSQQILSSCGICNWRSLDHWVNDSLLTINCKVPSWWLSSLMISLIFSYKAWGALLGRRLAERGIIVACIDYRCWCLTTYKAFVMLFTMYLSSRLCFRPLFFFNWWVLNDWFIFACLVKIWMSCRNFPQGTISDMVTDASEGISFVCNNAASFGGDPNK